MISFAVDITHEIFLLDPLDLDEDLKHLSLINEAKKIDIMRSLTKP